ncbi:hypothetical protein [Streptococcus suis]
MVNGASFNYARANNKREWERTRLV